MTFSALRSTTRRAWAPLATVAALGLLLSACGTANPDDPGAAGSSSASATATLDTTTDVIGGVRTDPASAALLPDDVRSGAKKVSIGWSPAAQLPLGGLAQDGKTPIGFNQDLLGAVQKKLGITLDVQNASFDGIVPSVQGGRYDLGQGNFAVTRARLQAVDFVSYYTDGQSFAAPAGSTLGKITDLGQICGLTVGTSAGSSFQNLLNDNVGPRCTDQGKKPYVVQAFSGEGNASWLALQQGKVDLYMGPTSATSYAVAHTQGVRFLNQFTVTPVGYVLAKGSPLEPALRSAVNGLIDDGTYEKILTKWGLQGSAIDRSEINPAPVF